MASSAREDTDGLLARLRDRPDDQVLREQVAHELAESGRAAESAELLREGLINLTSHGGEPLPCLCKRCLDPANTTAAAGGLTFHREFVTSDGRVLYFWLPDELLEERARVRQAVQQRLRVRLASRRRAR